MGASVRPLAGVKIFAGVVAAAFILSLLYAPLIHYIPFVYLNVLVVLVFGYAIGMAGRARLRGAGLHSLAASLATGLAGGIAGMFFAWIVYICVVVGEDYFTVFGQLLAEPSGIFDVMNALAEDPVWSVSRRSKNGSSFPPAFYYAVWAAEFLIVVGGAVKVCWDFYRSNRLCDACGGWLAETGETVRFAVSDGSGAKEEAQALRTALANGDAAALAGFSRLGDREEAEDAPQPAQWLEAGIWGCPCSGSGVYAMITLVTMKDNKKEEPERDEKVLWRFVRVSGDSGLL